MGYTMTNNKGEPMAASKDEKAPAKSSASPEDEALLKKGELTGKVRGPDVDSSFHVYEFTDPETGEPVETKQTVHDDSNHVK
jgi:hypothetical protein